MSRREQRSASALLFLSAYLVALLLSPFYDPTTLDNTLRSLFLACAIGLVTGFIGFTLSFQHPATPRPLAAQGDDHAE